MGLSTLFFTLGTTPDPVSSYHCPYRRIRAHTCSHVCEEEAHLRAQEDVIPDDCLHQYIQDYDAYHELLKENPEFESDEPVPAFVRDIGTRRAPAGGAFRRSS